MNILRWMAGVLRSAAGCTGDAVFSKPHKDRRFLENHEGVDLHVVKDDPEPGDVAITANLDWVFPWTDEIGTRRVKAWITTRDMTRSCDCGCGHSCDSEQTTMTVTLDYPYNNGGVTVGRGITDFGRALGVARTAAAGDIDKVLAENREVLANKQRNRKAQAEAQAELRQGIEHLFGASPDGECPPARAHTPADAAGTAMAEDWTDLFGKPTGNNPAVPARVAETEEEAVLVR